MDCFFDKSMRSKTLKKRIHKYISNKQDICCETNIKRNVVIQQIFDKYKKFSNTEYLNYINNDLIGFIGYYVDLEKAKDKEGMRLWRELDKQMLKNKDVNEEKVVVLLNDVPLYFLLSFLGFASYLEGIRV
jgi:hypothetical protein